LKTAFPQWPKRLRKNSAFSLLLGGAALQRCGKRLVLNAASEAAKKSRFVSGYRFSDIARPVELMPL
jgi:hypothetical protein